MTLLRRAVAELVGTAFLVMTVVGSGIAAQRLSPHDTGLQLLENSLATGAALVALILALQPVSASKPVWAGKSGPAAMACIRTLGLPALAGNARRSCHFRPKASSRRRRSKAVTPDES